MLDTDLRGIQRANKAFWDETADEFAQAIVLPHYGGQAQTEEDLHLFGDVAGKKLLDIGCGSGGSLLYHGENSAAELWGVDISESQLRLAKKHLAESGHRARLICAAMEEDCGLPQDYFDYVYSIYAIGWTTDLPGTFRRIAACLKPGGTFIFSWSHHIHMCVEGADGQYTFARSYFDEGWHRRPLAGKTVSLASRMVSTYVNALAQAGFAIRQMIEAPSEETLQMAGQGDAWRQRAQMIPLTAIFKAQKL